MPDIQHLVSGAGAPSAPPPSLGAHYIDQANGDLWQAVNTSSIEDWRRIHARPLLVTTAGPHTIDGSRDILWRGITASGGTINLAEPVVAIADVTLMLEPGIDVTEFSIHFEADPPLVSLLSAGEVTDLLFTDALFLSLKWIAGYGWCLYNQSILPVFTPGPPPS